MVDPVKQELVLKRLLDESLYFIRNAEFSEGYKEKALNILDSIDNSLSANTRLSLSNLPLEIFVRLAEISIESGARDQIAQKFVSIILQHFECRNQFYVRTLLAQAFLESREIVTKGLKAEIAIEQIKKSWETLKAAIEICVLPQNKVKYQFLVYNASITMWKIVRLYVKTTWGAQITEILDKLTAIIEDSDDVDVDWRCRLLSAQALAMTEAGKKPEGQKILDKAWDLFKKKGGITFEESLIRMRIFYNRDNAGALGNVKKDCDTADAAKEYKHLFVLQQIKCGLIPEANVDKELFGIVRALCPCVADFAEGKLGEEEVTGQSLAPMAQDRLAEASRLALKYGFIKLCEGCCLALGRAKQSSLRGKIWSEYSKAELVMKRPRDELNRKTKMKKTPYEKIAEDTECRIDMLKQMERAMIANNRLNDPDVILEGCYMIWNNSIPLLKGSTRKHAYKPLLAAANFLEKIQAVNEAQMRAAIHLELAKHEITEDFLSKAETNIKKALALDYSIPQSAVKISGHEDDYPGDYQRVYERTLKRIKEQMELKLNIYKEPEAGLERFILDVENSKTCKNPQLRESLLSRTLAQLKDFEFPEFEPDKKLVQEEKEEEEKKYKKTARAAQKQIVLLATEIAKQAFEINAFEMTGVAAGIALQLEWDAITDPQLVLAQAEAHLLIAQSSGELLLENDVEICYEDLVLCEQEIEEVAEENAEPKEFTEDQKNQFHEWKQTLCTHISKSAILAQSVNQSWLVYNICVYLWNNYLKIFREAEFSKKIFKGAKEAFKDCYQSASKLVLTFLFDKENSDYLIKDKCDLISHIGLYYARLEEDAGNHTEAVKVCDDILSKQPPPHLRKHFDALKAAITKQVGSGKAPAGGAAKGTKPAPGKQPAKTESASTSKDDSKSIEVISYVELITATKEKAQATDMLKKAIDAMNLWTVDPAEEEDLELYAEQWTRLGQLAFKQNTPALMKTALVCAENACKVGGETLKKYKGVPDKRLRWYALAKCLYGDTLRSLVDPTRQEKESQEQLLVNSVLNFVEGAEIAKEAGLGFLVLEAAKRMWNSLLTLLESKRNRLRLVEPLCKVTKCLSDLKENSDPDFLALLYAATFGCITETKDWKIGEEKVEEAFQYVPQTHHRVLWEAKVLYMSKQGKNVFHAVSSMKEATASLQAKVWLKLARSSANVHNQFSAYQSAVDVLKKDESIEVVEVIIELSEWLLRNGYSRRDIEDELMFAADTLLAIDPKWEEDEDEVEEDEPEGSISKSKTKSKVSSSRSKSKISKAQQSKKRTDMKSKISGKSRTSKKSVGRSTTNKKSNAGSSKKSSLTFTKRGEEEAKPLYLGCSHYDKLFRINAILAILAENVQKQKEYLTRALNFAMYMWQSSYQIYSIRKFIESHKDEFQQKHGYRLTPTGAPPGTPLDPEITKMLISDILTTNDIQIPIENQIPFDEQGWLNFELPQEFLEWAKKYQDSDVFSYWSFLKPSLSFYYLNQMLKMLDNFSMQIQKIPILKTLIAFSDIVAKDGKLSDIYKVHLSRECTQIGLSMGPSSSSDQSITDKLLDSLCLSEEEKRLEYENIKLQAVSIGKQKEGEVSFTYKKPGEPYILEQIVRTHERWMLQANEHILYKRFVDAKELLDEAAKHCEILNDYQNYAECMHMTATLFNKSNQGIDAVPYHYQCTKHLQRIELLGKSVALASKDLRELHRYSEARSIIENSLASLKSGMGKENDLTTLLAILKLHGENAMLCISEAKEYLTIPLRLNQLVKQSVREYKETVKLMQEIGGSYTEHIETAIEFIEELNKYTEKVWDQKEKRDKKQKRSCDWLAKIEEILVDLKCFRAVDPIIASKLKFRLDELLWKSNTVIYKIKGQLELLKAPPPPDPPKPKTEEENVAPPASPEAKKP